MTPFLTYLATERDVSISTQNQALNALLFLYREVLSLPMVAGDFVRVRRPPGLPTVLTQDEMRELLASHVGHLSADDAIVLWHRHAAFGTAAVAGEGCGFWPRGRSWCAPARGERIG